MVKFCPYCGTSLEAGFKFCPECGKKLPIIKKTEERKHEKVKTTEPIKEEKHKHKKIKIKIKLPKISFKMPKKTAMIFLLIICIAVVVSAAAWVAISTDLLGSLMGGSSGEGRTFTINCENDYESTATCYVLIDGIKQGLSGIDFDLSSGETKTFQVGEDTLLYQRDSYTIKLIAEVDDIAEEATASGVTESVDFLIESNDDIGYHQVNCTAYQ